MYNVLSSHKAEIETDTQIPNDWRELPERKACRHIVEKSIEL